MENLQKIAKELIDLNMDMVKRDDVDKEYVDRIIELKNDYERLQEELNYYNWEEWKWIWII